MSLSCSFQLTWVWKRDTVSSGKTGSLFVTSGVYMYMLQLDWGKEHSTSVWDTALPGYWLPIYLNVAYLNVGCSFFYISPFLFSNNFYFLFPSDFWSHGCVKASGPCMCLFLYRMCCSALLHMAPSWSALLGLQWVFCVWPGVKDFGVFSLTFDMQYYPTSLMKPHVLLAFCLCSPLKLLACQYLL